MLCIYTYRYTLAPVGMCFSILSSDISRFGLIFVSMLISKLAYWVGEKKSFLGGCSGVLMLCTLKIWIEWHNKIGTSGCYELSSFQ